MNKLIILFLLTLVQNIEIRDDLPIFDVDKLDRVPIYEPNNRNKKLRDVFGLDVDEGYEFYLRFIIKPTKGSSNFNILEYEIQTNTQTSRHFRIEPSVIKKYVDEFDGRIRQIYFYQYYKFRALKETDEDGIVIHFHHELGYADLFEDIEIKFNITPK